MFTRPNGDATICCVAQKDIHDAEGKVMSLRTHTLEEIWNSEDYKSIRRDLLDGKQIPHCAVCYQNEGRGILSYRDWANVNFKNLKSGQTLVERVDNSIAAGLTAEKPVYFDLRLGNICNLRCRSCDHLHSSQIARDAVHVAWDRSRSITPETHHRFADVGDDWSLAEQLLGELTEFCHETESIQIAGGEPTLNQTQQKLLQYFVDSGKAPEINLTVWTNFTNLREDAFTLFSQFKKPAVFLSLDGYGKTVEYIRFPVKWKTITANFAAVKARFPKLWFHASPVFQAYNALDITLLLEWCVENGIVPHLNNILSGPEYLQAKLLPQEARNLAAERLEAFMAKHAGEPLFKQSGFNHDAPAVCAYLRNAADPGTPEDIESFVRYTNDLDQSRKQNIRESLPELFEIWHRHRPWDDGAHRFLETEKAVNQ